MLSKTNNLIRKWKLLYENFDKSSIEDALKDYVNELKDSDIKYERSFGDILDDLKVTVLDESHPLYKELRTMAVSDRGDLFINLDYVNRLVDESGPEEALEQIKGVFFHEAYHKYNDTFARQKKADYDNKLWNYATDIHMNTRILNMGMKLPNGVLAPSKTIEGVDRMEEGDLASNVHLVLNPKQWEGLQHNETLEPLTITNYTSPDDIYKHLEEYYNKLSEGDKKIFKDGMDEENRDGDAEPIEDAEGEGESGEGEAEGEGEDSEAEGEAEDSEAEGEGEGEDSEAEGEDSEGEGEAEGEGEDSEGEGEAEDEGEDSEAEDSGGDTPFEGDAETPDSNPSKPTDGNCGSGQKFACDGKPWLDELLNFLGVIEDPDEEEEEPDPTPTKKPPQRRDTITDRRESSPMAGTAQIPLATGPIAIDLLGKEKEPQKKDPPPQEVDPPKNEEPEILRVKIFFDVSGSISPLLPEAIESLACIWSRKEETMVIEGSIMSNIPNANEIVTITNRDASSAVNREVLKYFDRDRKEPVHHLGSNKDLILKELNKAVNTLCKDAGQSHKYAGDWPIINLNKITPGDNVKYIYVTDMHWHYESGESLDNLPSNLFTGGTKMFILGACNSCMTSWNSIGSYGKNRDTVFNDNVMGRSFTTRSLPW